MSDELKQGTIVTINVPFRFTIGNPTKYTGKVMYTEGDCMKEVIRILCDGVADPKDPEITTHIDTSNALHDYLVTVQERSSRRLQVSASSEEEAMDIALSSPSADWDENQDCEEEVLSVVDLDAKKDQDEIDTAMDKCSDFAVEICPFCSGSGKSIIFINNGKETIADCERCAGTGKARIIDQ